MTIAIGISIISLIITTYFAYKNSNRQDNETTGEKSQRTGNNQCQT